MKSRQPVLFLSLMVSILSGCATHELVLSRTLNPNAATNKLDFSPTLFRARVQMGRLEVWSRVSRSDGEYAPGFDTEMETAAALCAYLAENDRTFENDWGSMHLELTTMYGSQWHWKNTYGYIKVRLSRSELLDLRGRNVPASEYPAYWHLEAATKVGPPDYVAQELRAHDNSLEADDAAGGSP